MTNSAFDDWYNGMVGFHINSERILYELYAKEDGYPDPTVLRKWMAVCWNAAIEHCEDDAYRDFGSLKENT